MTTETRRPTELQQEISYHGNEGDLALHRSKTLSGMLYEELAELTEGDTWSRDKMERVFALLMCVDNHIEETEQSFDALWKAARRASGSPEPAPTPEDAPWPPTHRPNGTNQRRACFSI